MRPTRIVFYGNFGAGNLGNEVTLQTAIEQTLKRLPGARLICVCTNPSDVRTRHGIEAAPSLSREYEWSWSEMNSTATGDGPASPADAPSGEALGPRHRKLALSRLGRIVFRRVPGEFAHWYRMLRIMMRSDVFVVPGTGIITDGSCGSLGWPYDIFKLSVLARLCRVRIIFLSIGAGPFHHRLGGWLIRRSLGLAHYRSYRDADSRRRLEDIGFRAEGDAVYPDLVFGLSPKHLAGDHREAGSPRIIALGLKDYASPSGEADIRRYRDYLGAMANFVVWLQRQGNAVRLTFGDAQYDTRVREDLIAMLEERGASTKAPLLLSDPVPTVDELLSQLRAADAVISPRFHNLVLALLLEKPVLALSDLPKVTALLTDLGLERFCLPLEDLKADDLTNRFERLANEAAELRPFIKNAVEKCRGAVDAQYETVYGPLSI